MRKQIPAKADENLSVADSEEFDRNKKSGKTNSQNGYTLSFGQAIKDTEGGI